MPVIDLRGRLVVPGFIDNHVHFVVGGVRLGEVQLRDAPSRDAFRDRIAAHANAAWSVFAEDEIGTIAPGMRADLVVLSDDLFTIAPEEIAGVQVEMTIFDGRVISRS